MSMRAVVVILMHCCIAQAWALDAKEIKGIAAKPHDRQNLLAELQIFPDGREYEISLTETVPGKPPVKIGPVTAVEKAVEARYIVSTLRLPGSATDVIIVVTYDKHSGVYRKWEMYSDTIIVESVGISTPDSRAISWMLAADDKRGIQQLALEQHSDTGAKWTQLTRQNGKIVLIQTGEARKTK